MIKNIFSAIGGSVSGGKTVRGFSPVELVIMVGFAALTAGALIYLGTTPHYTASTQPVNVNIKVDSSEAASSRQTAVKAEEVTAPDEYQATNSDGSKRWLLNVTSNFTASDLTAAGGTLEWYWEEAGIVTASSSSDSFEADIIKVNGVQSVSADLYIENSSQSEVKSYFSSASFPSDAYLGNIQWYLQAIGAVTYSAGSSTPEWQLGDYKGTGVTVGFVDTGAPARWIGMYTVDPVTPWYPEIKVFDGSEGVVPKYLTFSGGQLAWKVSQGSDIKGYDTNYHGTAIIPLLASRYGEPGYEEGLPDGYKGKMRGLTPKAKIISYNNKNYLGSSLSSISIILMAWRQAAVDGVQILNNSWNIYIFPQKETGYAAALKTAFTSAAKQLDKAGVLLVAAAGNSMIDLNNDQRTFWGPDTNWYASTFLSPVDCPNFIVASGTGPKDYNPTASDLSVYNPLPGTPQNQKGRENNLDRVYSLADWRTVLGYYPYRGTNYGSAIDVAAPSGNADTSKDYWQDNMIYSAFALPSPYISPPAPAYHGYSTGTSAAAPFVTAVAALAAESYYREHGVKPSPATLKKIILSSADDLVGPATDDLYIYSHTTYEDGVYEDIYNLQYDVTSDKPAEDSYYGKGRVNAKKAIEEAKK